MLYIGKLNINLYNCVTDNIVTEDVIITDEQVQHIKNRHPLDYEKYSTYFPEIISNPDYIIESNKEKTAVILKEIANDEIKSQTILRLCTMNDPEEYKNSIITFMKIDSKRWNRYLRTKKILYSKESI